MTTIRCLYDGHFKLAESPLWCERSQSVWWVNMLEPSAIYRLRWNSEAPEVFSAPYPVTGIVLAQDDSLLVGSVGSLLRLDPSSGKIDPVLELKGDHPGNRCNEMGVDPKGRLWVGTMTDNLSGADVEAKGGALFRISAESTVEKMLDKIGIPNTLIWSAEGDVLFTADSYSGIMRRMRLDEEGRIASVEALHGPGNCGVPDGSALATDETLWNARWSAGCLLAIGPDGEERGRIEIPGGNITSACFAGPDRDTLVVTASLWGLSAKDLADCPQAGGVFALEVGSVGVPVPRFAGRPGDWPVLES